MKLLKPNFFFGLVPQIMGKKYAPICKQAIPQLGVRGPLLLTPMSGFYGSIHFFQNVFMVVRAIFGQKHGWHHFFGPQTHPEPPGSIFKKSRTLKIRVNQKKNFGWILFPDKFVFF
jgi:hypothetical protein